MIEYIYDGYGNLLNKDEVLNNTIAKENPFIYKGYYYDFETGLYYLTTRYYDPEIGRFISADDVSYLEPESINGLNLYAYCGNNPIMRIDPNGTAWWNPFSWSADTWKKIGGVALIVGGIALTFATAGLAGVVAVALGSGLVASIVGGAIAGAVIGAASGALLNAGTQIISSDDFSWSEVGKSALTGAISGAIAGGIFGGIKHAFSASKVASNVSGLNSAQSKLDSALTPLKNIKNLSGMPFSGSNIARTVGQAAANYNSAYINLFSTQVSNFFINLAITGIYAGAQFGIKQLIGYSLNQVW